MIQDFDSQLQVALTALQDVVVPALADGEKHVVEQLMLAIMTVGFVKQRLPDSRKFYRMELRGWADLGKRLTEKVDDSQSLEAAIAAAEDALGSPEADLGDYTEAQRDLRNAITAAYAASAGQSAKSEIEALVLEGHGALTEQNRLWLLPLGYEIQPEALPEPAWR